MSKELPYFEFEPAEYLAGDISFCSLESQGLFILICCYYWQRSCSLTKEQFLKRTNKPKEFDELITEKIIKIDNNGFISINFLDEKFDKATEKSKTNSKNGAKGGRPKKQKETEIKPTAFNSLSETKGIIEDNIIKEEIKEYKNKINNIEERKLKFASTLTSYKLVYDSKELKKFYDYWTEPNKSNTKFRQELEKTWSLERRLETWFNNSKNFNKEKSSAKKEKPKTLQEKYSHLMPSKDE